MLNLRRSPSTFMICVHRLCHKPSHALSQTKFHFSDTNQFVTDMSQTFLQSSQHVKMVCVRDFHDLHLWVCEKISVKVNVMEFGLNGTAGKPCNPHSWRPSSESRNLCRHRRDTLPSRRHTSRALLHWHPRHRPHSLQLVAVHNTSTATIQGCTPHYTLNTAVLQKLYQIHSTQNGCHTV